MKPNLFALLVSLLLLVAATNSISVCRDGLIQELEEGEEMLTTDRDPEDCLKQQNDDEDKQKQSVIEGNTFTPPDLDEDNKIDTSPQKKVEQIHRQETNDDHKDDHEDDHEDETDETKSPEKNNNQPVLQDTNQLAEQQTGKDELVEEVLPIKGVQNIVDGLEETDDKSPVRVHQKNVNDENQGEEENKEDSIHEVSSPVNTDSELNKSSVFDLAKQTGEEKATIEGENEGNTKSFSESTHLVEAPVKPQESGESSSSSSTLPTNLLKGSRKSILLQRFNRSGSGDEISMKCEPRILAMIGISSTRTNAEAASPDVRNFCHRNFYSCCSLEDITDLQSVFKSSMKSYNKEVAVIEEILTLFKGPNFMTFFTEHKDSTDQQITSCTTLATEINSIYWDNEFRHDSMIEVERLLNEMDRYYKRNLYWAANSVCSVCNPFNHQFFNLEKKTVTGSDTTCREILEERDYELRFAKLFHSFIHPTSVVMRCLKSIGEEEAVKDAKEVKTVSKSQEAPKATEKGDEKKSSNEEQIKQINKLLSDFDDCFANMNSDSSHCTDLCNPKLASYNNIIPIVSRVRESIYPIFSYFIDEDSIEGYYKDVKNMDFTDFLYEDEAIPFVFHTSNTILKVDDLEWDFSASSGITVMTDHMNKKFYKKVDILGVTLLLLSYFFF